jgi:gliding motility-associated-like protein
MRPITQLFLTVFLLLAASATGQNLVLTTTPSTVNSPVGSSFTVDIKAASGFTNITSFQFPVRFDKNVLELVAVENLAPIANPALAQGVNYNINPPASSSGNRIVFSWITDPLAQPSGASLPDGTTIATLRFNVKASGSIKIEIIPGVPPGIEVFRSGSIINVTTTGATTNVTAGSGGGGGGPLVGFKIVANTVNIPKGQTACMPVTVNEFTNMISMQYAMHWDPAVLTFECIKGINLPGLAPSDFLGNNTTGLLTMGWADPAGGVTGVTRANGTSIYEVCFKGSGNNGAQALITIDGVGLPPSAGPAEAANLAGQNLATAGFGVADTLFINPTTPPVNAITFSADLEEIPQNSVGCVDIRGKGFTSVTSVEFPIVYDTMMLRFQSIQVGANPLSLATGAVPNANFTNTFVSGQPTGVLRFVWANPTGVNLATDTSVIFRACFRAKGAVASTTPVTLGGGLACNPVSVARKDVGSRPIVLTNGSVTVKNAGVTFTTAPAVTNVACFGGATGSISVAPAGCGGTYSYSWNNGQTTAIANNLAAGTYTVTVTCSSGGTGTASGTVTQPASAVSAGSPTVTPANCPGTAGGAIAVAPTGGLVPYRYAWAGPGLNNPLPTTATISNLRAGTFTVTVTDERNCTTTSTITVTATSNTVSLTPAQITRNNATCTSASGSIVLAPTGGTGTYTYSWANSAGAIAGATTNTLRNIPSGNYSVTVTDGSQCTATATQMNVGATPSPVTIPAPTTVSPTCAANTGSITVNPANGVDPYSYSWTKNGAPIANAFTNTLTNQGSGTYNVTATDSNGCSATATVTLNSAAGSISAAANATPSRCYEPATGAITLTPSGGRAPYTVTWSGANGFTSTATSPANLRGGNYRAVVTDADGCAFTTPEINVPGPTEALGFNGNPAVTSLLCAGGNTGAISITPKGGTSGYNFQWAGPNGFTANTQNISNLVSGTYTTTITDANQCTFTAPVVVNAPAVINPGATVSNSACGNNGSIQLNPTGGNSPYTFLWSGPNNFSSTNEDIVNLSVGSYQVTIRDASNCTFTPAAPFTLTGSTNPIALSATAVRVKCINENTGGATLTVTGGGQITNYRWFNTANTTTPVSNTQNLANVAAGIYNLVVTDVNGCTATLAQPIVVNGPQSPLSVTQGTITGATCPEAPQGSIALTANGGWGGPYLISWSGGLPAVLNPTNVAPGTYTYTVTDVEGCAITPSAVVVPGPAPITLTAITVDSVRCAGSATGRIVITPSGGNGGPYSVIWNGGILSGTTIGNLRGKRTYTPTVSDKDGCVKAFPAIYLGESDTLKVAASMTQQMGTAANGAINITVTGGTKPYTFEWFTGTNPVGTTEDITGLSAGVYKVFIKDALQCSTEREIEVTLDNPLSGSEVDTVINSCENDGCVRIIIPPAAQGPFIISWSNGGVFRTTSRNFSICSLRPGLYNMTITDVASTRTLELPVTEVRQLDRASFGSSVMDPAADTKNGSIFLTPNPTSAPISFTWQNGPFGPTRIGLDSGTYIVTARHLLSGCTAMDTFRLQRKYPALAVAANVKNETCIDKNDGSIALTVTGGNNSAAYQYRWTGPGNFPSISASSINNLAPGIYACTVTDVSGNTSTYSATITTASNTQLTNVNEISNYNNFQVSGVGRCDGIAEAVVLGSVGGITYEWSNGATTQRNATLCGGAYGLTIRDALGCTAVWSDALTTPERITAPPQFTKTISCSGRCDAAARVTITGGLSPYRVSWSVDAGVTEVVAVAGGSSERLNLCPGNYTVTITDRNDVAEVSTITVAAKSPIAIDINDDILPTSFSDCDGELLVSASGTTGSILYAWSSNRGNRGNERRAENLCPGEIVTFIITDGNGCTGSVTDTVPNPENGCLQVRPVITPGEQDGKNDVFIIACVEEYQNTVEIYNRWGQLVFETENYDNASNVWSGTTRNGDPLPAGAYFYVINFTDGGGGKQQLKGYVNLLR